MILKAEHLALSGTPVENNLGRDCFALFRFLNPAYSGSGEEF